VVIGKIFALYDMLELSGFSLTQFLHKFLTLKCTNELLSYGIKLY